MTSTANKNSKSIKIKIKSFDEKSIIALVVPKGLIFLMITDNNILFVNSFVIYSPPDCSDYRPRNSACFLRNKMVEILPLPEMVTLASLKTSKETLKKTFIISDQNSVDFSEDYPAVYQISKSSTTSKWIITDIYTGKKYKVDKTTYVLPIDFATD